MIHINIVGMANHINSTEKMISGLSLATSSGRMASRLGVSFRRVASIKLATSRGLAARNWPQHRQCHPDYEWDTQDDGLVPEHLHQGGEERGPAWNTYNSHQDMGRCQHIDEKIDIRPIIMIHKIDIKVIDKVVKNGISIKNIVDHFPTFSAIMFDNYVPHVSHSFINIVTIVVEVSKGQRIPTSAIRTYIIICLFYFVFILSVCLQH